MIPVAPEVADFLFERLWIVNHYPRRAPGSPLGLWSLSNLSLTEVLRLFSLTLAGMGQEFKATILAIITPSWMRVSTRTSLTLVSLWLEVFLKNEENRFIEGILLKVSPAKTARTEGLFLSSKTISAKLRILLRAL